VAFRGGARASYRRNRQAIVHDHPPDGERVEQGQVLFEGILVIVGLGHNGFEHDVCLYILGQSV
jgi:hypothetical protein